VDFWVATKKICSAPKSVGKIFEKPVFLKKRAYFFKGCGVNKPPVVLVNIDGKFGLKV